MNKIESLIQQYCPNGVEFFELKDVFDLRNGYTPSKANSSYWSDGTVPWFRMEDIRENGRILDKSLQLINSTAVKGGRLFPANSILIATSATIGEHALVTVPHLSNQRFTSLTLNDNFANKLDVKFVFYYCFVLDEWCRKHTTTSSFASVDMTGFKKFPIPVPPLEVQKVIVDILDSFTELEAELGIELEAELEARKKQYEYYRDQLLTFDDNVHWVQMSEVCDIYDGTHQTPKYKDTGVKFVSAENINSLYETKKRISADDFAKNYRIKPQINDVFMTRIGTIGVCAVVDRDEDLAYYVTLTLIRPDQEKIMSKYIKFVIESRIGKSELRRRTLIHAVPIKINLGEIGKIKIPLPTLQEQSRIISILDNFEKLAQDISKDLPIEIGARRKQYEYYRNKLLTFQELSV